jgi:DNA-binding PadR family transcriptional regulator
MDGELYKALLEAYGEICPSDLNKALMKLEVDGLIRVYTLTRNKRRVELVEELKN